MNPKDLLYTKTHEWARIETSPGGEKIATVGITAFAYELLTDLVFVALPEVGKAAKAAYLGVNALMPAQVLSERIVYRLEELLKRYKSIVDKRKSPRISPNETERFELLFTHPDRLELIGGVIGDVSLDGARLFPWDAALTRDLRVDQRIRGCSLRIGSEIVTVNCRVVRNGQDLGMEFESFEANGDQTLFQYLVERPDRELRLVTGRA